MPVGVTPRPQPKRLELASNQIPDSALLAAVGAGDAGEPLRQLYRRYGPRVFGLARRQLGDPEVAEEIVQETFVRLWKHAKGFDDDRGAVATFIFTIARRLIIDMSRRRALAAANPVGSTVAHHDDEVDRLLTRLEVQDALSSLSDTHREALALAYEAHLPHRDIAQILGVPEGTVKSRVYYALRSLKAILAMNAGPARAVYPVDDQRVAA